ncbi:MAG: glycyl-radical enzyme activating protein family [Myxococcaceae bacterium]|nr:glycyl-radical enzyme activating protein family [Myxococcaceae bacterium]
MRVEGARPRARVFDVQRFSVHDGPGIRTTVFLSGCTLRCAWCHNPESFSGSSGRLLAPQQVLAEVLEDRDYYSTSGGGLTVSGGEPLIHREFLRSLLELAKGEGLHTCVQTAGAVPAAALLEVLEWVDLFQFDLKHMDPQRHRALTGASPEQIHQNAALLLTRGAKVEFRVPLVPGHNDDAQNLERVRVFLEAHGAAAVRLVPYQRGYLGKYQQLGLPARCAGVEPPSAAAVEAVAQRFRNQGLAVAIDA